MNIRRIASQKLELFINPPSLVEAIMRNPNMTSPNRTVRYSMAIWRMLRIEHYNLFKRQYEVKRA